MYTCTEGKLTIGVGFNLEANAMCDAAIGAQLRHDIEQAQKQAAGVIGDAWKDMDEVRRDVVTSMVFQMGAGGFAKFTDTIKFIQQKKWADAASAMLQSKWARQTKKRAERLSEMMRTGVYVR